MHKLDKNMVTGSISLASELAFSVIIFTAIGYLAGNMIGEVFAALGMFLGATLGLSFMVYRIYRRFP